MLICAANRNPRTAGCLGIQNGSEEKEARTVSPRYTPPRVSKTSSISTARLWIQQLSCGSREDFGRAGGNQEDASSPHCNAVLSPRVPGGPLSHGHCTTGMLNSLLWPVRLPQISLLGSKSRRVFLAQRKIPLNSRNYNPHLLFNQSFLFPSPWPQLLTQPQGSSIPKGDKPPLLEKSPCVGKIVPAAGTQSLPTLAARCRSFAVDGCLLPLSWQAPGLSNEPFIP